MKKFIVAMALLITMLVPVSTAAGSDYSATIAQPGCRGMYILKAASWSNDVTYASPSRPPFFDLMNGIRLVGNAGYYYCPNGRKADKIKPLWVEWCYTHIGRRSDYFDGVKFNPYFFSKNMTSNPPQVKVPNNRKAQNCVTQNIDTSDERWLKLVEKPAWTVSAWVVVRLAPDQHHDFKNGSSRVKYFDPHRDFSLSPWRFP